MASEETENSLENNLTKYFLQIQATYIPLSTELLVPWNSLKWSCQNRKNFCLTHSLPAYTNDLLPNYWAYSLHSFPEQSLFLSAQTFLVIVSLSLVSGKSAFLHDGYIATIENCCAPMVVKHILFIMSIASLLLGTLYNMIIATRVMSSLLGISFNTQF